MKVRLLALLAALGVLALLSLAFVETRNGAALVMCALCFAGLIAARVAGFSNRALVPVAVGLIAILGVVVLAVPCLALFLLLQRQFVAASLAGALKG